MDKTLIVIFLIISLAANAYMLGSCNANENQINRFNDLLMCSNIKEATCRKPPREFGK